MRDPEPGKGATFATLLRETRRQRGMTQDELIEVSGVSRSTLLRWEKDTPGLIDPAQVRKLCEALELDPREALIALGFVTRSELELPAAPPPVDRALLDAARLLADTKIPEDAKESLRGFLIGAVEFWHKQLGVRRLREPSAAERAKGKPVTRK